MLGKLIKYEFKATCKFMFLIYTLLIAMAVIISVSVAFDITEVLGRIAEKFQPASTVLDVFAITVIILFVVVNVVVFSGMFFYAIKRFKDNLLGDEGYLMHTLPVKTRDNIIAKCTVSVVWTMLSSFVVIIAYTILAVGMFGIGALGGIPFLIGEILENGTGVADILLFSAEGVILSIVMLVSSYLHIYASMAAGYSYNTHRVARSIGIYVVLSMIASALKSTTTNVLSMLYIAEVDSMVTFHIALCMEIIFSAACAVVLYFITHHFMNKKLNLQ